MARTAIVDIHIIIATSGTIKNLERKEMGDDKMMKM